MATNNFTHAEIAAAFLYDPVSGMFYRKTMRGRALSEPLPVKAQKSGKGYLATRLNGRSMYLHRLAWMLMHGHWPNGEIDHINGNITDNTLKNLRDVSVSLNQQNRRGPQSNNKLGVMGVTRHGSNFRATIVVNRKQLRLGTFKTPEQANAAYLEAKRAMHPNAGI